MRRLLAPLLALLCTGAPALEIDRALDAKLQSLLLLAYDRPEEAERQLDELARDPETSGHGEDIEFTRARVRAMYEDPRAIPYADRLVSLAGGEGRGKLLRAEILEKRGQMAEAERAATDSRDMLERSCATPEAAGGRRRLPSDCDFRALWAALRIVGQSQSSRGAMAPAESSARRGLELATLGEDRSLAVRSLGTLANASQQQGQAEETRRWLAQARETAGDDDRALAQVRLFEGFVAARNHDALGEYRAFESALALAVKVDATHFIARMQTNLADFYLRDGKPREVLRLATRAMPVLVRFKDRVVQAVLAHNTAIAEIQLHHFDQARAVLAQAEQLRRGNSDVAARIRQLTELSEAWAQAHQPREAIRAFREERELTAQVQTRDREAALEQARVRFDAVRKQHELELLQRDAQIKDQELANQSLAQKAGWVVTGFMALSLLFAVTMLVGMRGANQRLKSRQELLRIRSERDPLTDLANRRHFLALMEGRGASAFQGALLMVDIDHFKRINDDEGHLAGDAVIGEVARRLRAAVRDEDVVVRWGGEEYLVFAPAMAQERLQHLAERMLGAVGGAPVRTGQGELCVTVSIGFVGFPLPPGDLELPWERAVNWADMALFAAKAAGRNCAIGIEAVRAADSDALVPIEADFQAARSSGRVSLVTIPGPAARDPSAPHSVAP